MSEPLFDEFGRPNHHIKHFSENLGEIVRDFLITLVRSGCSARDLRVIEATLRTEIYNQAELSHKFLEKERVS